MKAKISYQSVVMILFLITSTLLFDSCETKPNKKKEVNLLSNMEKEFSHVDSIVTNKPLSLSSKDKALPLESNYPYVANFIPIKASNKAQADDSIYSEIEIPDTIKNVKPIIVHLKPFVSFVEHPQPVKAREMRSSSLANSDIQYLNVEQGLPNSNIHDIDQDKNGYLWFSHPTGITRYDGNYFYNYTISSGLPNGYVASLLITKKNHFWLLTLNGLVYYDGLTFKTFNKKSGLLSNQINDMLLDDNDNLWFTHQSEGLGRISNDTVYYYNHTNGFKKGALASIGLDSLNRIFVSFTDDYPMILDEHNKTIYNYQLGTKVRVLYWNGFFATTNYRDDQKNLWTGTYGRGVVRTTPYGRSQHFNFSTGFDYDVVSVIYKDKLGKHWFGTNDGGMVCKNKQNYFAFTTTQGLTSNHINAIFEDKNHNIWVGTNGGGINRIKQNGFNILNANDGFTSKHIITINKGHQNDLLIGTAADGLWIYNKNKFVKTFGTTGQIINTASILDSLRMMTIDNHGRRIIHTKKDARDSSYYTESTNHSSIDFYGIIDTYTDKNKRNWLLSAVDGLYELRDDKLIKFTKQTGLATNMMRCIAGDSKDNLWIANAGCGISKIVGKKITHYTKKEGLISNNPISIFCDSKDHIWIGTTAGLSKYDGNKFVSFDVSDGLTHPFISSIIEDEQGNIWVGTSNGLNLLKPDNNSKKGYSILNYYTQDGLRSVSFNRGAVFKDGATIYWGTQGGLISLNTNDIRFSKNSFHLAMIEIDLFDQHINYSGILDSISNKKRYELSDPNVDLTEIEFDSLVPFFNYPKTLTLPYNINSLTFRYATQDGNLPHTIVYRTMLKGYDKTWNTESNSSEIKYANLPAGSFEFNLQAKIGTNDWCPTFVYKFSITPPFWERWWFRTLGVLFIVFGIWRLFKWRNKQLLERQVVLENTVAERTKEINLQKHVIEEKQKEIVDSITYAKRIQYALLASNELLSQNLNDHFVFFQPKDLVSGDFYWATKLSTGNFILATADSTGHGVPGAIMSILNISCLNESIKGDKLTEPAEVLNETRAKVIHHLANDGSKEGGKDGMDCSLISIDPHHQLLTYAAANNAIWIIRDKKLTSYPADRMPVGKHDKDQISFKQTEIELMKGDLIYTFTDGFPDQFGGPYGKKFKYKQLEEFLLSICHHPMIIQKELLTQKFNTWKGDLEQIDDVLVIGIKI